jgi:3-hydroxyisobutyrate dehydrogenase
VICVSDTPDVQGVILGEHGVIHGARPGALVIDCSTISPQATREMAAALAEKGVFMLDAPVSGGSEGAAKGTLSIMVGGESAQFDRALPIFQAMGKTITHVGGHGAGQTVKLVNQVLVVGNAIAMCEALMFAQAGGVDLQKTYTAISQGAAGSWMFTNRAPQIMARDWRPGFTIDLQQKDLRLVLEAADELGVPIPCHQPGFSALSHASGTGRRQRRQPRTRQGAGASCWLRDHPKGLRIPQQYRRSGD